MPSNAPKPALWWKRYPKTESRTPREPGRHDIPDPRLTVGTLVRLCGKPDKARAILEVEWHWHRYRYVYVIETSGDNTPYWFSDQLMLECETQPVSELFQKCADETIWHKVRLLFMGMRRRC